MSALTRRVARALLLSPHPFVLEQLGRWLARPNTRLDRVRLAYSLNPTPGPLPLKRGSVCVLDACLPLAALESLTSSLLAQSPEARILVVAEELSDKLVFPLLRLGVKGFLTYDSVRRQFAAARAAVARGGFWVPRGLLSSFLEALLAGRRVRRAASHPAALSRRERDVLEWLLQNLSNKEIADRLNISERTVKFHVSNVLAKFSVQRRADLILKSFQARLVVP